MQALHSGLSLVLQKADDDEEAELLPMPGMTHAQQLEGHAEGNVQVSSPAETTPDASGPPSWCLCVSVTSPACDSSICPSCFQSAWRAA